MTTSHRLVHALRSGSPCLVRKNLHCRFLKYTAGPGRPQDRNDDPSSSEDEPSSTPRERPLIKSVRSMMRDLTHPLAVIVAQSKDTPHPTGLLVSSFNTVTMDPVPHVTFNLKLPSSTYDEIKKSAAFTASAITRVQMAKEFLLDKTDPRYAIALRSNVNNHGHGKLTQEKGAIWWMRCQWLEDKSVQVGDHVLVIGKVISAGFYKARNKHGRVVDKPLAYGEGQFRYAGPPAY